MKTWKKNSQANSFESWD